MIPTLSLNSTVSKHWQKKLTSDDVPHEIKTNRQISLLSDNSVFLVLQRRLQPQSLPQQVSFTFIVFAPIVRHHEDSTNPVILK